MPGWKKQQNELNVQHQLSSLLVFEPRMICCGMICCFFVALLDKRGISEASDRLHQLSSPIQTPVQPHAKSHTPTHTPTNKEPNLKYYHRWRKSNNREGWGGGPSSGMFPFTVSYVQNDLLLWKWGVGARKLLFSGLGGKWSGNYSSFVLQDDIHTR